MHNWDIELAWTYHEETKHSYDSVYRSHHFLDWANQPRPLKVYSTLEPLPLPTDLPVTERSALLALSGPAETIPAVAMPTLRELAYIMFYAAGVTRKRTYPGYGEMLFRAAACTGALYHIDLYLVLGDIPGLSAGVYHFDPKDFALRQLRQGDYRRALVQASGNNPALQNAPVLLISTDTFWRNAWKYRARAYRHGFWDAGTMLANLVAAANALGVPVHLALGFADAPVNDLLGLETQHEAALCLVGLGAGGTPVTSVIPTVDPLALEVLPVSAEVLEYSAISIMHAASGLETPEEAAEWRGTVPESVLPSPTGEVIALCPDTEATWPRAPLEEVVRQRGSTRRFAPRALTLAQLSHVLLQATQPIPADFLAAPGTHSNDLYLIINAVEGVAAGSYVYHPAERGLERLASGDFRQQAGELALGQERAAEASVAVFCLCDLGPVLEQCGNRGYRAAQLEAGMLGGRMYLAAYAQGFGATGLTFFDDDVTAFFSPHAAEKCAMFLIALGYAAPRRTV